ncbi:MAG: cyclic nucleotide-binding domain-containing protein, partial [Leptospiraceae bacterium]|nr:cyclic nucleotide-binding domain-containing protein [Leptospiraceae bacterium]
NARISYTVYATLPEIIEEVKRSEEFSETDEYQYCSEIFEELETAVDFLTYGQSTSRIFLLEYDEEGERIKETIRKIHDDPWLHGTVIIILAKTLNRREMNSLLELGVADIIFCKEILYKLPTVIKVIAKNFSIFESEQFLLENTLHEKGKIILPNLPSQIPEVTNQIIELCYTAGFRNLESYTRISICLHEMITNSVEHGNCKLGYETKTRLLDERGSISGYLKQLTELPENKDKKVLIYYDINAKRAVFTIADEGDGFSVDKLPSPTSEASLLLTHGRGILMTRNFVDRMKYNRKGNRVSLLFHNQNRFYRRENELVKLGNGKFIHLKPGELLFEAGSESDFFYYIISGRLGVYVNEKEIALLGPEDVFIGEMAFLHHNKRTGTVRAKTHSTLVPISRTGFITMIKKYPYAGVFLARLLTKRLILRNQAL